MRDKTTPQMEQEEFADPTRYLIYGRRECHDGYLWVESAGWTEFDAVYTPTPEEMLVHMRRCDRNWFLRLENLVTGETIYCNFDLREHADVATRKWPLRDQLLHRLKTKGKQCDP